MRLVEYTPPMHIVRSMALDAIAIAYMSESVFYCQPMLKYLLPLAHLAFLTLFSTHRFSTFDTFNTFYYIAPSALARVYK